MLFRVKILYETGGEVILFEITSAWDIKLGDPRDVWIQGDVFGNVAPKRLWIFDPQFFLINLIVLNVGG